MAEIDKNLLEEVQKKLEIDRSEIDQDGQELTALDAIASDTEKITEELTEIKDALQALTAIISQIAVQKFGVKFEDDNGAH